MPGTRVRRRKEARPGEITEAAMLEFADKGYDATRVHDVARRAGISKGLLYLYFKTKEELFKSVIRSFVSPRVAELEKAIDNTELSAEEFLRGPFLALAKKLPRSPARHVVRLMISEGPKHPDLTAYYWENVITPGLAAMRRLIARAVERGEFRATPLAEFPQLVIAPVMVSVIWTIVFDRHERLDTDALLEAHVDTLLAGLRSGHPGGST